MSQALEILNDIASDTMRNAAGLPLRESVVTGWQGLGFQIGGVRLVAHVAEIAELMLVPKLTHLPGVKKWVLGMANVRGRLIPIIDMHRFLQVPNTGSRLLRRVLIVESGEMTVGLVVEQSLGMQHFLLENFEKGVPGGLHKMHGHMEGAYRHGGRIFYIAKLKELIEDRRFMDVSD